MTTKTDIKFYSGVLKSNECQCGKAKKPRFAFCYSCFQKLPAIYKRGLYSSINDGFPEAYEAAHRYLQGR